MHSHSLCSASKHRPLYCRRSVLRSCDRNSSEFISVSILFLTHSLHTYSAFRPSTIASSTPRPTSVTALNPMDSSRYGT